jgi:hypothetical protein
MDTQEYEGRDDEFSETMSFIKIGYMLPLGFADPNKCKL